MLYFTVPYSFQQRLFEAYDQEFNRLNSNDDWLAILDGDVAFLNADFGHHIQEYIDKYPDTGIFTCYASRCHYKYMIPRDGDENNTDILFHKKIANSHAKNLKLEVKPLDGAIAGHLMVIRKSTWLRVRDKIAKRTRHERIEAVDTAISKVMHEENLQILLMRGIYVFHYCRFAEGYKFRKHLGYNNFINIITPSVRPENLAALAESINIPRRLYRWIVVIDGKEPTNRPKFPRNAEVYYHHNPASRSGNDQRNFALNLIKNSPRSNFREYVYFLDDDTLMHPYFYEGIQNVENDFIHFDQANYDGTHRIGGTVQVNKVDSGNCLIKQSIIGDTRWRLELYNADGVFMSAVFQKTTDIKYIPRHLSIYNALRPQTSQS